MSEGVNSTIWIYGLRGRMTQKAKVLGTNSFSTSWLYNSADLPISMTYPDGETVTTSYNAQGVPNGLQNVGYGYDRNGNIVQITDTQHGETSTFTYDELDRLTGNTVTGGTPFSEVFTYDPNRGRMSAKGADLGSLVSLQYDANHPHAVSGFGSGTYGYDANGNQTSRSGATLNYDAENHLVQANAGGMAMLAPKVFSALMPAKTTPTVTATAVLETPTETPVTETPTATAEPETPTATATPEPETPTATAAPEPTITPTETPTEEAPQTAPDLQQPEQQSAASLQSAKYVYDGDGTLVKGTLNGVVTYYASRVYQKEVNGGTVKIRKYYSFGAQQVAMRTDGTLSWIISDHLGSATITANADGSLQSEMRYTAFGEVRTSSGTMPTNYQYTGQLKQAELGLYFYVSRFYDPQTAHFVQADTMVPDFTKPQFNDRYAYSLNNPIKYSDPSGHCPICILAVFAAAAIILPWVSSDSADTQQILNSTPEQDYAEFHQRMDLSALILGVGMLSANGASMAPDVAMKIGSDTGNTSVFNWGASQYGLLPSEETAAASVYSKTQFQGRTVYQRNDIDWDNINPKTGLTNRESAALGNAPIGPDGKPINLHHLLQEEPGPMAEIPQSIHQRGQKILHGLVEDGQSFRRDQDLLKQYNQFRSDYWKWRSLK